MVKGLTSGEDVETDLTSDRVCEAEMTEFLLESRDHGSSDFVFLLVSYSLDKLFSLHCRTFQSHFVLVCYSVSDIRSINYSELTWHFDQRGRH